jgi:hypothetical protein
VIGIIRTLGFVVLLVGVASLLGACRGDEPTPILVYVTTTPDNRPTLTAQQVVDTKPESETTDNAGNSERALAFPGPSRTPAVTSTLTATPSPTPTNIPTVVPVLPTNVPPPAAPVTPNVPPPEQLPILTSSRMGVQMHPFLDQAGWEYSLGLAHLLNVKWVKIQIKWDELESQPGQYSEFFTIYAQRVQLANVNGFRVLLSFVDAPDWARPAGFRPEVEGPPADPQHLANFIQQFIIATKPQDHRIAAIEVWNEPNVRDSEWDGMPLDGATYMQYFRVAYDAIKAVDPSIVVVTAGLAPVGDLEGAVSDRRYLQQMYDAGLASFADVKIGVHPYGWGNPPDERCCTTTRAWANNPVFFFLNTLEDYIAIAQRNGHNTLLWVTEFGWGTYKGVGPGGMDVDALPANAEFFALVSAQQQAEYTVRAFEIMQQAPLGDAVEIAFLWNLNFAALPGATDQRLEQAGYSLIDASGNLRLVFHYLLATRRTPE